MKFKEGRNISQGRKEIPQGNVPEMPLFVLEHNITLGKWFKDLPVLACRLWNRLWWALSTFWLFREEMGSFGHQFK